MNSRRQNNGAARKRIIGTRPKHNKNIDMSNDTIVVKGNDILTSIISTAGNPSSPFAGSNFIPLKPSVFGDRVLVVASVYSRWKINKLQLIFKSIVSSSTNGALALGLLDDADVSNFTGNITSFDQVVNLRDSQDSNIWKDFVVDYRPVDPKKWYYTNTSGGSERFTVPATIFGWFNGGLVSGTNYGNIRLQYELIFKGATPVVTPSLLRVLRPTIISKTEPAPCGGDALDGINCPFNVCAPDLLSGGAGKISSLVSEALPQTPVVDDSYACSCCKTSSNEKIVYKQ